MPRRARHADHAVEDAMMRQVGLRLLNARQEARLSQAALGAMIGVTNIQIGCYERGVTALSVQRAVLLADALGIEPATLLPTSEEVLRPRRRRVEEFPELIALYRRLGESGRKEVFRLLRRLLDRNEAE